MSNKEKLEAIREVIEWVDSKKQDLDNGLEEMQYILDGSIKNINPNFQINEYGDDDFATPPSVKPQNKDK